MPVSLAVWESSSEEDDCIDDMDNAVGGLDVGEDDVGVVDGRALLCHGDIQTLAVGCDKAWHLDDVSGVEVAGDDVVQKDPLKGFLVLGLEEGCDGPVRKLLEGCIGGREDRVVTLAVEGIGEAGGSTAATNAVNLPSAAAT